MEPHRNHWQVDTDLLHLGSMYSHPLDTQLYNDRPLCEIMGDLSSKDVIDIGCGNGYLSRKVAKQARTVMGIDSSQEMIDQAIIQSEGIDNLHYQAATVASPENLPFPDEAFDVALCSLTVNNVASTEMMKRAFREIARVVKSRGLLALSLPHPLTLDATSKFRWTEWEPQQSQTILVPGEDFLRKLMVGKGAEMFAVRNYYWPPDVLKNLAQRYGLVHSKTIEATASEEELEQFPHQLEAIQKTIPFFLAMGFTKTPFRKLPSFKQGRNESRVRRLAY